MRWHVNPHSGVPLYVQIEEQVKTAIASGVLESGERLPTVRELALELTINPNTVARAYRELERAGFITTTPGRGTFVTIQSAPIMSESERRRRLSDVVERMLTEARALGYSDDDIVRAVQEAVTGATANFGGRSPAESGVPADGTGSVGSVAERGSDDAEDMDAQGGDDGG